jgi:hypothetical protein
VRADHERVVCVDSSKRLILDALQHMQSDPVELAKNDGAMSHRRSIRRVKSVRPGVTFGLDDKRLNPIGLKCAMSHRFVKKSLMWRIADS